MEEDNKEFHLANKISEYVLLSRLLSLWQILSRLILHLGHHLLPIFGKEIYYDYEIS